MNEKCKIKLKGVSFKNDTSIFNGKFINNNYKPSSSSNSSTSNRTFYNNKKSKLDNSFSMFIEELELEFVSSDDDTK